jgi:hypothetical protein
MAQNSDIQCQGALNPGSGAKAITSAQSDKPVTLRQRTIEDLFADEVEVCMP